MSYSNTATDTDTYPLHTHIDVSNVALDTSSQATVEKITEHLWIWAGKCKSRRDAYWNEHYNYYIKNNWISIPLILMSGLTSVVSVTNIGTGAGATFDAAGVAWASTVLAFGTSVLAALQRYFKYGERAEQCKAVAKNYTRIAYMIEFTNNLMSSNPQRYEKAEMEKLAIFAETVRKDLELVINDTNDIPDLFTSQQDVADMTLNGTPLNLQPPVAVAPTAPTSMNPIPEEPHGIQKSLSHKVKTSGLVPSFLRR